MTGKTVLTSGWIGVYPTKHTTEDDGKTTRAVILVNHLVPTNAWTQIEVDSLDITAIKFKGNEHTINVYNIYNDCNNDNSLKALQLHLRERKEKRQRNGGEGENEVDVWLGDFNRHHPMWESEDNHRLLTRQDLDKAEFLLQLLGAHNMELVLPKGVATIRNSHGNHTRPDNVFTTSRIEEWVAECQVRDDHTPPNADHFPIQTTIMLPSKRTIEIPQRNFRATDWVKFNNVLKGKLKTYAKPKELATKEEMTRALEEIEKVVTETMDEVVPRRNTTTFSKRWWTKELEQARKEARKAAGKARRRKEDREHPAHEAHRKARNTYGNLLAKTKKQHWEEWIGDLDSRTMWDAHRFTKAPPTDGGRVRIPALKTTDVNGNMIEVQDNEEKSKLLHKAFFFEPPQNSNIDPNFAYPEPAFTYQEIKEKQIIRIAKQLSPYKAPGLNEISNSVLTHCIDQLAPYLGPIFRATVEIGEYPEKWKKYTTVVLRKGGKSSYKTANAYRPIALLDVIAKLLAACIKETLEYHVERLQLLPERQFGGRPGCTTTDSLHMFMKFTKDAWRQGEEVVALFLDVKGAFPNTVIPCLMHDMRLAGVPQKYTDWMTSKMTGRETVISFDDYRSKPIPINNGLDQGCNLSMLAYRFYNASQITASIGKAEEMATNYADDAIIAARGKDLTSAAKKVEQMFHRRGGPLEWAKSHFSNYEYEKFAYIPLTRKRIPDPDNPRKKIRETPPKITLDGKVIRDADDYKFLGVIIDKELRFKKHALHALEKGTRIVNQIRRLSKMAKGMKGEYARRMYYSCISPSMLYAADVWCAPAPIRDGRRPRGMDGAMAKLQTVERKAAIQITGALRTTPTDLLLAHADMYPIREQINQICQRAALRMATLPDFHPLYQDIEKARRHYPKKHPSPLHAVMNISKLMTKKMETIDTRKKGPRWTPCITPSIAPNRKEGMKADRDDESDIKIYTDGSGQGGKIGAAATLQFGFRPLKIARHHLGRDRHHTVFEGECVGQLLGLGLLEQCLKTIEERQIQASIAVDNQASLRRYRQRDQTAGSYIIQEAQEKILDLKEAHKGLTIKFRWVPGHEKIPGSERVDKEAKKAAEGKEQDKGRKEGILSRELPRSRAATKQEMARRMKEKHQKEFRKLPRYRRMKCIDEDMPSDTFRKANKKLSRSQGSILIQLRTEHIPLEAYLHKFKKVETPTCQQCGDEPETVTHYLKYCKAYRRHRTKLRQAIGRDTPIDKSLLGKKDKMRHLFSYISNTRRFEKLHGDVQMKDNDEEEPNGDDENRIRREWA